MMKKLAFADGKTDVLVWGGGDTINLTVGRSDLWDHRMVSGCRLDGQVTISIQNPKGEQ